MTPIINKGGGKGGNRSGGRNKGQKAASKNNGASSSQEMPCHFHSKEGQPANHKARQCCVLNKIKMDTEGGSQGEKKKNNPNKKAEDSGDDVEMTYVVSAKKKGGDEFPETMETYMIFVGPESARAEKATLKEINAIVPAVPQYLEWSEQFIGWKQEDHPPYIPKPGRWALVVDPIIDRYKFSKVLMNGESSINILYPETLHRMRFLETQLKHSHVNFHGVIPGRKCKSLGSINLNVTFGTPNNFRTENLHFEVVQFKSAYHAIFRWPAFARSWHALVTSTTSSRSQDPTVS
jgi:hypothetical protein